MTLSAAIAELTEAILLDGRPTSQGALIMREDKRPAIRTVQTIPDTRLIPGLIITMLKETTIT